ncbi:MAG: hypothetical protein J0H65_17015 [Rhizobiales bacterium]|nr:hypothetical protein [Hyphomicrobiales bacterium]
MNKHILAALMLALSGSVTLAAGAQKPDESSLSGKVMHDLSANKTGTTATPTAQPDTQSLSGKVMHEQPGAVGAGRTDMPTAKPAEQSLSGKAMRDQPGNN